MQSSDSLYTLQVRPNGRTIADEYLHQNNTWIEGREGSRYDLIIGNRSSTRALFIVAVDGLDVIEGKPAGTKSQGYIVDGYSTVTIPGWKLNNQEAAEFFFSRKSESYVNAIGGSTSNTGVIGAMIFREKNVQLPPNWGASIGPIWTNTGISTPHWTNISTPYWTNTSSSISTPYYQSLGIGNNISASGHVHAIQSGQTACINNISSIGASVSPVTQDVGTGFGEATSFKTTQTTFVREDQENPTTMLVMYYNTAKNLQKMGIQLRSKSNVGYSPNPFPAGSPSTGCIPPKDWVK